MRSNEQEATATGACEDRARQGRRADPHGHPGGPGPTGDFPSLKAGITLPGEGVWVCEADWTSLERAGDSVRVSLMKAVAAGAGIEATAGGPYREAKRWVEVWRETGAVAQRKTGKVSKLDEHEGFLRQLVADQPAIKLAEIHDALDKRGIKTSQTSIWNALGRFGIELATSDVRRVSSHQPYSQKLWKGAEDEFNPDMLSDKAATRRAQSPNEVWEVDVAILDVPGRPRIVIAVDLYSRLPTVAAVTSGAAGDIVDKLDAACRPFGYPQEIRIDGSFEFTSPALREWSAQHDVTLTFRPLRPASKAILEKLHVTLGGKPSGDE
jgi:transposase